MSKSGTNKSAITDPFLRPWLLNNVGTSTGQQSEPNIVYVIAGGLTGVSELVISYPFDYIKTHLQLSRSSDKINGLNTFKDVVKRTVEKRGLRGLYRGVTVAAVLAVPRESSRFGIYEALKRKAVDKDGHRNPTMFFLCGFGAGFCEAAIFTTPMEAVKISLIRDQLDDHKYTGSLTKSILRIMKQEGIRGLYRGMTPTVLKQGTNQGIRFYVVETMKLMYRSGDQSVKIPSPMVGLFGILGGLVSVFINNPIDVIKTRMQGYYYKNVIDCFRTVSMNEGYSAFYKGIRARIVRVAVDAGVTFMLYDFYVSYFRQFFIEDE